ncbi:unnamed protein product [Schistocephalus solidus]|uniref:C2H2-type domain-containing protein n=1 Tax=Schistocephalus solidus TaxID=70667 RepID=A0A183SIJ5_SCHSO|nr:unnamed protein product [Schistocephalus solidus]
MPSPNKNKRTAPASTPSCPEKSPCISKADFGIGSYVMALWRNQFEYLAEVLAFRNRSRDHPEYRLKFVWDRVVEWTPASRVRKATQAEISYVLKFVRRYGDGHSSHRSQAPLPGTNKVTKHNCKGPVQEEEAPDARPNRSKNCPDAMSPTTKTPPKTSTTQSFGAKQAIKSDTKRKSALPATHHLDSKVPTLPGGGGGSGVVTKPIAARDGISIEGTVAHGDMLYDKSIAQFHEACRKRRELKRQAIDSDESPTAQQERKISSAIDVKPPPAKKSNVLTQDIKLEGFWGRAGGRCFRAGPLAVVTAAPPVKSTPTADIASKDVKRPSISRKIPPSPILPPPTTGIKEGVDEASPVAFQCPHCPRKLRRYSLLTAHICNYHRDDLTSSSSASVGDSNSLVHQSPKSPLSTEAAVLTDAWRHLPAQQSSPPRSCAKREAARSSQTQSRLPTGVASVSATGPSKERQENLVRCLICRVWCHRRCLISGQRQQLDGSRNPEFENWICESCATVPPHMPSSYRLHKLSRGWGSRCLTRDGSAVEASTTQRTHRRNLFSEALSLVNWLHQLQPMLVRGRQAVRRLRSSVATSAVRATAADRRATEPRLDRGVAPDNNHNDSRARSHLEQRFNGSNRYEDPSAEAGLTFAVGMDLSETDLPFIGGAASDDGISALLMNLPDMNLDALVQDDGETDAVLLGKKSLDLCEEEQPSSASASAYLTQPRRSSVEDPLALSVSSDISRLIDNLGPDYLLGGLPYPADLVDGGGQGEEVDDLWKRSLPSSFLCSTSSAGTSAAGTPADTPALLAGTASGNCLSPFDTPTKAIYSADGTPISASVVATVGQEAGTMDGGAEKTQVGSSSTDNKPRDDAPHIRDDIDAPLDFLSVMSAPRPTARGDDPGDQALPVDMSVSTDPSWLEVQTQFAVPRLVIFCSKYFERNIEDSRATSPGYGPIRSDTVATASVGCCRVHVHGMQRGSRAHVFFREADSS